MLNKEWVAWTIIGIMFALAFAFHFTAPDGMSVPVARDAVGEPVDYGNRFTVFFALPVVTLAVYLLLNALPHIAVYRRNIERFYEKFYGFKVVILLFLVVVYLVQALPAVSVRPLNSAYLLVPALAALFFYMGHVLKHIHRNYFIGFLTPWALSSDKLWDKTHHFGGAVLEICGAFMLVGLFVPNLLLTVLAVASVAALVITFVYSYLIFSRSHHHHHR